MTIEQYGHGPHIIRIARGDFVGTYRFWTLEEARAFKAKNGGYFEDQDGSTEFSDPIASTDRRPH